MSMVIYRVLPSETDQSGACTLKDFDILVAIKIHSFNHMKEKWAPLHPLWGEPLLVFHIVYLACYP